jgi:phosphopantothenoylcysteine decarboxylase/phosphopantothenate--cysteine ligase
MAGQNIILGVTGGIAAYKTPELVRRLRDRGAEVQVVLTRSAREFVTETTLQAVSGRAVRDNLWDKDVEAAMGHIELARWADQVLIAPATAEIISRLAQGAAPDLLTTLCLATEAPIAIAPAMNHVMWNNAAVQQNRQILSERGVKILGPAVGDQACGETGPGRMLEPEEIAAFVARPFSVVKKEEFPLHGKTVMITAGPTREAIDAVRYITNRSSGKMGYAMATAARDAGAKVVLVSGPVAIAAPKGISILNVESANDMYHAVHEHLDPIDIFIATAAVADYHAVNVPDEKIKKTSEDMSIDLARNPDVLASVSGLPTGPFTVGFAAETRRLREYALGKLVAKNLNMIVGNLVGEGRGFDSDENAVEVFWRDGEQSLPMKNKTALARDLIALIAKQYDKCTESDTQSDLPAISIRD